MTDRRGDGEAETAVLQVGTAPTVAAAPGTEPTLTDAGRTTSTPPAKPLPTIDPGVYAIGEELAHGGMGRIRLARDLRLDREVAIKELLEPSGALAVRFEREVLVTAQLQLSLIHI